MLLSAFVTLCEGYLGIRPTVALWTRLCHFKSQVSTGKVPTAYGVASIYANQNIGYPNPKPLHTVKKWQRSFFYVSNTDANGNCHNLPEFVLDPPAAKLIWGVKAGQGDAELDKMVDRVHEMHE